MKKLKKDNTETLYNLDSGAHIEIMPDELAMTINKAKALSNRSGTAWLLFQENQLIASYSGFSGHPMFRSLGKLPRSPRPKQLYISSPPYQLSYTAAELSELVDYLPLDTICYPWLSKPLSKILAIKPINIAGIKLIRPVIDSGNESLFFGPATIQTHQRPWTNCFVSMDVQGQCVKYQHLLSGFGAESALQHVLRKHAIVAVQKGLSHFDPKLKSIQEHCCTIGIDDEKALTLLQQSLAKGGESTLTMLCDYSLFCKLANANIIDECRMYIALTDLPRFHSCSASLSKQEGPIPSLFGWKVISTQGFDAGILLQMRRDITGMRL